MTNLVDTINSKVTKTMSDIYAKPPAYSLTGGGNVGPVAPAPMLGPQPFIGPINQSTQGSGTSKKKVSAPVISPIQTKQNSPSVTYSDPKTLPLIPTPTTPIGDAYTFNPLNDPNYKSSIATLTDPNAGVDAGEIRQQKIREMQDRVNALNQVYDQQLAKAQQEGVGRVGQTTSILANRGLAGSARGGAIAEGTLGVNRQIESSIQNERNASIQALMTEANNNATTEAQRMREAKLAGAKNYIEALKQKDEIVKGNLTNFASSMIAQGIDPSTLSPEELSKIATANGVTTANLIAAYKTAKTTKDAEDKKTQLATDKTMADIGYTKAQTDNIAKKFEEDKRQFGLEYALKVRETAVKEAEQTAKASTDDSGASSINLINTLLSNPKLGAITGTLDILKPGFTLSSDAKIAKNQYKQLKGILALENRSKLKGSGAVSDFESKTLEAAASALGRELSNAEFVNQLKQVRGSIATSHGIPTQVTLRNPSTGDTVTVQAGSAGIAQAVKDGLIVIYD